LWPPSIAPGGRVDAAQLADSMRHSFCSLLLAEGRSVVYVARQLGHRASLTTDTYGHVIDELDGAERVDAEAAIRAAREAHVPVSYPRAAGKQV
jgi:integrase